MSEVPILPKHERKIGLVHWMDRALKEHARFSADPSTDVAHDLRVALRRCRVLAAFMADLDPDGARVVDRTGGKNMLE